MDKDTYENWVRVKETFEASGNTDNFYYRRACAIVGGGSDPLDNMMSEADVSQDGWNQAVTLCD